MLPGYIVFTGQGNANKRVARLICKFQQGLPACRAARHVQWHGMPSGERQYAKACVTECSAPNGGMPNRIAGVPPGRPAVWTAHRCACTRQTPVAIDAVFPAMTVGGL